MKLNAGVILFGITILILGGFSSIYLAGDLVSSDARQSTRLEQIEGILESYGENIQRLEADLSKLESLKTENVVSIRHVKRIIHSHSIFRTPDNDEFLNNHSKVFTRRDTLFSDPDIKIATNQVAKIGGILKEAKENIEAYENKKKKLKYIIESKNQLEQQFSSNILQYVVGPTPATADWGLLLAAGMTHFGILVIVVLFIQILFGVYRYSQRLSTFYAARADALVAAVDRKTDLGGWGPTFLPDTIDFGRHPTTPARYVVDTVEAYYHARKKRKGKEEPSEE